MSPQHIRIAELAKEDKDRKFSSMALVNKVVFERRVIEPPQSEIETWH
jgi:hypothetical protein